MNAFRRELNELRANARANKAADKRVERLYYKLCSGIQVDIMDIRRVFTTGRLALAQNPAISDEALGNAILDFVQTIRKN